MAGLNQIIMGNKRWGDRVREGAVGADETALSDYSRLPTGIFPLDYALAGGIPFNVGTQLYGPYQGGKSTLAYLAARALSKFCMHCMQPIALCGCETPDIRKTFLCHTEGTPPTDIYFRTLGYESADNMIIGTPSYGEEGAEMVEAAIQADDCGLVILDSLPGIAPRAELESGYEDMQVATQSRLFGKMARRLNAVLATEYRRGHLVAVIFLNQLRTVMGGSNYGPSETCPGGWAIKHFYRCSIRVGQLRGEDKKGEVDKTLNVKNSLRFSASLLGDQSKQQMFLLAGKCEYKVCVRDTDDLAGFEPGAILDSNSVIAKARELGLLEKAGSQYVFEGTDMKFQRLSDIQEVFRTGQYVDCKTGEVLENADDIMRFKVIKVARSRALRLLSERGRTVRNMACASGDAEAE